MHVTQYDHTQRGKLHYVLHFTALAVAAILLIRIPGAAAKVMICCVIGTTAIIEFFAFTCVTLRVYDDQDCLKVEFGPLPLLKKRIAYKEIVTTRPSRSKIIDGWGIHYIPGRGWTYNVWGFDCVELSMIDSKLIRVGTDDPAGLHAFLEGKISS